VNWESAQTLLGAAVQTASDVGVPVDLGVRDRLLRQTLVVSAVVGTLDVRLEASPDGVDGWRTFATFARASAAGAEKLTSISPERWVRVAWTITDSASFGVSGAKGICYANLDDYDLHGVPKAALASRTPHQKAEALAAASTKADGKLKLRYDMPLVAWGADLTAAVVKIAAYEEMSVRGFSPDGSDQHIRDRHNDGWKWLAGVAKGEIDPVDIIDSSPELEDDGVVVVTHPAREWR
jgi:phage gp36-like protein